MLTQKKRRRKRKKSAIPVSNKFIKTSSFASGINSSEIIPTSKSRLSNEFMKEEMEVRNAVIALSKKQNNISKYLSSKIDKEISFFINHILVPDFDKSVIVDPKNNTPSSGKTTIEPEYDAQQLASSYVQIDDKTVIQKWTKLCVNLNDFEHFYPDSQVLIKNFDLENVNFESKLCYDNKNIAEDGLLVYKKPYILKRNQYLMINRFIEEGSNKKWLNYYHSDKTINISDLRNYSHDVQLYKTNNSSKTFKPVEYLRLNVLESVSFSLSSFNDRLIRIYISEINFYKHPSYTKEYIYAKRLEFLYKQYSERLNNKVIEKLQNHLQSIRHLLQEGLLTTDNDSNTTNAKLKNDLRDTRNQLHRENKFDRELLQSLLEQWKILKELRKKQGFNTTSIRILIKKQDVDIDADQEKWNETFEAELNEIIEETLCDIKNNRNQFKSSELDIIDNAKDDTKIISDKVNIFREELYRIYMESMRNPGESIVSIEMEQISIIGKERSSSDSSIIIIFQVMFDDQKVGSVKRNFQFAVNGCHNVNAMFSIKLTKKIPEKISLNVRFLN